MPWEPNQKLCNCADKSFHCLHDGKPGEGIKCMSRDDWYSGAPRDDGPVCDDNEDQFLIKLVVVPR